MTKISNYDIFPIPDGFALSWIVEWLQTELVIALAPTGQLRKMSEVKNSETIHGGLAIQFESTNRLTRSGLDG